jgi:two-component system alkaline phosphatase synthesis response regulator PhoP
MSKRVLVVEDEEDIRRLVSIKLKGAGYEVATANDGEEGLAAAVRDKPDLVVSDVMMPKKTASRWFARSAMRSAQKPLRSSC